MSSPFINLQISSLHDNTTQHINTPLVHVQVQVFKPVGEAAPSPRGVAEIFVS